MGQAPLISEPLGLIRLEGWLQGELSLPAKDKLI